MKQKSYHAEASGQLAVASGMADVVYVYSLTERICDSRMRTGCKHAAVFLFCCCTKLT